MKFVFAAAAVLTLAACAGKDHPNGTFFEPACMPDGSTVTRLLPADDGNYGTPIATPANCPWNKNK